MHLITISLGRNILNEESRERERMRLYAKELESLYVIVLSRKKHGWYPIQHEGTLHIYATHSLFRATMLIDAFRIVRKIIGGRNREWTLSAQDPLEIGWFSFVLATVFRMRLHVQVHGDYLSSDKWVGRSPLRYIRRYFALVLLRHAPRIRVVSERIKNSLIQHGVRKEIITNLPIRPELESFLETPRTLREGGPVTFLYLGRLAQEKDIPRILYAFNQVYSAHTNVVLRIVGDGSEKKRVTALVENLACREAVQLVPWTEDVPAEMSRADVFLVASLHEAYALTIVEAMASGLPIVTTDIGCVGEVFMDGIHGIVVKSDSVDAYAAGMEHMRANPELRVSYGAAGREKAHELAEISKEEYARMWVQAIIS